MKSQKLLVGFAVSILLLISGNALGQSAAQKAEFIIGLTSKIEWPAGKNVSGNGAIVIAVVGESPLIAALKQEAEKKSTGGKKIEIKAMALADDFTASQIAVIGTKELTELAQILKKVKGLPVLTVSDANNFAGFGVVVDFMKDDTGGGKLTFALNKMAAKEIGLKMSPDLVKQAKKTFG
jgi:hypothetical protein